MPEVQGVTEALDINTRHLLKFGRGFDGFSSHMSS
jgi:hypothetical protein